MLTQRNIRLRLWQQPCSSLCVSNVEKEATTKNNVNKNLLINLGIIILSVDTPCALKYAQNVKKGIHWAIYCDLQLMTMTIPFGGMGNERQGAAWWHKQALLGIPMLRLRSSGSSIRLEHAANSTHSATLSSTPTPKTIKNLITPAKINSGLDLSIIKDIKLGSKETPHKSMGIPSKKLPWLGIKQIKLKYKGNFCLSRCWFRFYWANSYYGLFPATSRNSSSNSIGIIAYYSWSDPTDPWI